MSDLRTRRRVVEVSRKKPPAELRAIRAIVEDDPDPDASYLDQEGFESRLVAYKSGEFGFLSVRLEADLLIEHTEQTLVSPGVSGIESDCGDDEIDRIVQDEWIALRDVLKAVGISTTYLPLDADREWIEWRTG